jgi:hypothetical protein
MSSKNQKSYESGTDAIILPDAPAVQEVQPVKPTDSDYVGLLNAIENFSTTEQRFALSVLTAMSAEQKAIDLGVELNKQKDNPLKIKLRGVFLKTK